MGVLAQIRVISACSLKEGRFPGEYWVILFSEKGAKSNKFRSLCLKDRPSPYPETGPYPRQMWDPRTGSWSTGDSETDAFKDSTHGQLEEKGVWQELDALFLPLAP